MKNLVIALLALLLITGLFIAGCGDDSGSGEDADGGGDADTDTDCDTDTDTDAGAVGEWCDPTNDLCWQDPPSASFMNWYVAAGVEESTHNPAPAADYCGDLCNGWRLPTISELRSLFRSGADTECEVVEWEMSWSSVPAGYCEIWEDCLGSTCYDSSAKCSPIECGISEEPGKDGCYWDTALSGSCESYWSASEFADYTYLAWIVSFSYGGVDGSDKDYYRNYVRCVRSGP